MNKTQKKALKFANSVYKLNKMYKLDINDILFACLFGTLSGILILIFF